MSIISHTGRDDLFPNTLPYRSRPDLPSEDVLAMTERSESSEYTKIDNKI